MAVRSSKDTDKKTTINEDVVETNNLDTNALLKTIEALSSKVEALEQKNGKIEVHVDDPRSKRKWYDTVKKERDIDPDDYMEIPHMFFSFSVYYAIWGDTRMGHQVETPYSKPFRFYSLYRYVKSTGGIRGAEVVSVSQCVVRSKKEMEWLRSHSLFGIKFFENMDEATSADAMLAQKMAQVYNEVSKMNDVMVVSTARSRGMDVKTPDISILRKELVANIAKESFKQEQRNTHSKLMESSKVVTKNLDDIATRGVGAADVY